MISIYRAVLATPSTMDADAYRELCWGAGLDLTSTGYGLLLAVEHGTGDAFTAVVVDVEYVRLLMHTSGGTRRQDHLYVARLTGSAS